MSANDILGIGLLAWFAMLALAEAAAARRSGRIEDHGDARLVTNFTFGVLALGASIALPLANLGAAATGEWAKIGIAHQVALPWWAIFLLMLLGQSFAGYWAHRLMHSAPALWRIHRVHHADSAVDVSTGFRNHPLELLISVPAESAVVLLVGAPLSAVFAVQTVLVAAVFWHHADISLPPAAERIVSMIIVTPRLHRLHHNPERAIHDHNYGAFFTWWDWLFGTLDVREGRGPVGLVGQRARPDNVFDQLCVPLHA